MIGPQDASESGPVLWDVIDEHLEEGSFALAQWGRRLKAGACTLDELASYPERVLLAHVDGLWAGGAEVENRILRPELARSDENDPARNIVIALGLAARRALGPAISSVNSDNESAYCAVTQALAISGASLLDQRVESLYAATKGSKRRAAWLHLAAIRGIPLSALASSLTTSGDTVETEAAARAAWCSDAATTAPLTYSLLWHADARVRRAALISLLAQRSPAAWQRCLTNLSRPETTDATSLLLVALLGGPREQQALVEYMTHPPHRNAAIFAAGYTGEPSFANQLLELMDQPDPAVAKLALEAFSTLTGVNAHDPAFRKSAASPEPDLPDDQVPEATSDDAEDAVVPDQRLPIPDVEAVNRTWHRRRSNAASAPSLGGQPWTASAIGTFLSRASLRRRHPICLWLKLTARVVVDPSAFTSVQRVQTGESLRQHPELRRLPFVG